MITNNYTFDLCRVHMRTYMEYISTCQLACTGNITENGKTVVNILIARNTADEYYFIVNPLLCII